MSFAKTAKPAFPYYSKGRHELGAGRYAPNCALGERITLGDNVKIGGCGGKPYTSYTKTMKPYPFDNFLFQNGDNFLFQNGDTFVFEEDTGPGYTITEKP